MEYFKDLVGFEGLYKVSNLGRIESLRKNKILKPQTCRSGYSLIFLRKDGKSKNYSLHRLIAITFLENPDNLPQVNHINGIKIDNRVSNLEWCTASYNIKHSYSMHGSDKTKGSKNGSSKLTESQVLEIKKHYKPFDKEYGRIGLAKKYNVSMAAIKSIVQNKNWKWLKVDNG